MTCSFYKCFKNELNSTKAYSKTVHFERDIVNSHISSISNFKVRVDEKELKLPIMYWIPKLHKYPCKARFIANSTSCTTSNLSIVLTSCLTAIKTHVIRYCETVYEIRGPNLFWSVKNSTEILDKFKVKNYQASSVCTYNFSTLYTTLPHNLISDKLLSIIKKHLQENMSRFLLAMQRRLSLPIYNVDL
jgi:hypothetical protein